MRDKVTRQCPQTITFEKSGVDLMFHELCGTKSQSLIVRDKVTKQCPQTTTFKKSRAILIFY